MRSEYEREQRILRELIPSLDEQTAQFARTQTREFLKTMTQYKCAMMDIESRFNLLNEEYALEFGRSPINGIKTRLKSLPSINDKLKRKNIQLSLESMQNDINDIAGVRVICAFPGDVYALAEALLRQDDISLIAKKDYIAHPKENGYRSLHLIVGTPIYLTNEKKHVKVEIQLRTIAMDFWASLEHQLRYKSDTEFTGEMAEELYQCAGMSNELDCRMDKLRAQVFDRRD